MDASSILQLGGGSVYKGIWSENVKSLLEHYGLSISQAAAMLGTSRQYLASILSESEPQSTKEKLAEQLCFLLHTSPGELYSVTADRDRLLSRKAEHQGFSPPDASPVETAILVERNFLAGNYEKSWLVAEHLLTVHRDSLLPAAHAQAPLLSGKSASLAGRSKEAIVRLKQALQFYRKRLTAQPGKYFPLCIDCYRYLGLTYYMDGEYSQSVRWLSTACRLAVKYPEIAKATSARLDEVSMNLLRAGSKQGSMRELLLAADTVKTMADACKFEALSYSVDLDVRLAQYPMRIVDTDNFNIAPAERDEIIDTMSRSTAGFESIHGYMFTVMLYLCRDFVGLRLMVDRTQALAGRPGNSLAPLAGSLLAVLDGNDPFLAERVFGDIAPGVVRALHLACEGAYLMRERHCVLGQYTWQESLGRLKYQRELSLYILVLFWYIRECGGQVDDFNLNIAKELLVMAAREWRA